MGPSGASPKARRVEIGERSDAHHGQLRTMVNCAPSSTAQHRQLRSIVNCAASSTLGIFDRDSWDR
jgi:hypothetical protein